MHLPASKPGHQRPSLRTKILVRHLSQSHTRTLTCGTSLHDQQCSWRSALCSRARCMCEFAAAIAPAKENSQSLALRLSSGGAPSRGHTPSSPRTARDPRLGSRRNQAHLVCPSLQDMDDAIAHQNKAITRKPRAVCRPHVIRHPHPCTCPTP